MKKFCTGIGVFALLMMCVISVIRVGTASAESGDNFIFSAQSNSIWVLNKSTKQMIFVQFQKEDKVWKSNQVTVPASFNLDKSVLKAVGGRGTSVFLYDKASGMTTLYRVNKDHSVAKYTVVDTGKDLK